MPKKGAVALNQRTSAGRHRRPAVLRTLQLIEEVARVGGMGLVDLARNADVPQATVFRLCQKLEEEGYLIREDGSRRFAIGPRLLALGLDTVRSAGPLHQRHAILSETVEAIGETCNITTLVGAQVLYLDRVETRWPLRLALEPGSRVPIHCTASGKLLLAFMPKKEQQRVLTDLVLSPQTPNSITDPTLLQRDLTRIAARGYSTDNEEFLTGLIAVAVPIRDRTGRTIAAIACHAPVARLTLDKATKLLPTLKRVAARLAKTFPG
jgi:DNA-binding IclR family transcriptional regulator